MQEIWLAGRGVGKARPRFSSGLIYMPEKYRNWKRTAIAQIKALKLLPAPKPCFVECYFVNFLSSDADNLQGAVIDALVQAGHLENDSSSFVVGCSGRFVKKHKKRGQKKLIGILVRISHSDVHLIA